MIENQVAVILTAHKKSLCIYLNIDQLALFGLPAAGQKLLFLRIDGSAFFHLLTDSG